jgi:Tol biopolymer transport system component
MASTILLLILAIGAVIVRGDEIGMNVVSYHPYDITSGRPLITVTFDAPIDAASVAPNFTITPAVRGVFTVNRSQVVFRPTQGLAANTEYQVIVHKDIRSTIGRTLKQDVEWNFKTRAPKIVFLANADGRPNLFLVNPATPDQPRQLTFSESGVGSYDVTPDGSKIVYADIRQQNSSHLFVHDMASGKDSLLYACDQALCANPAWRPDGGAVIFDYIDLNSVQIVGVARLWEFDLNTNKAQQFFSDNQITANHARWSPDGTLVAANDATQSNILLYNTVTGVTTTFPLPSGAFGDFSPDGQWLYYPRLVASQPGKTVTHIVLIDLGAGNFAQRPAVPDSDTANDLRADWLADSQGFVVARRPPFSGNTNQGTQLYRLSLDSGNAVPLAQHSAGDAPATQVDLRVSPGGDAVLYRQYQVGKSALSAELWLLDLSTGQTKRLAAEGTDARWLP